MSNQSTELILLTCPPGVPLRYSAMTVRTTAAYFVGREVVTHKRFERNYSSARYMTFKRHAGLGYYVPDVFLDEQGHPLPDVLQGILRARWIAKEEADRAFIAESDHLVRDAGFVWAKQQSNRQLSTAKREVGIVTATLDAWHAFFALRCVSTADPAMQEIACSIRDHLAQVTPVESLFHVPLADTIITTDEAYQAACLTIPARIARTSTARPGPGQRSDADLTNDLTRDGHMSPFGSLMHWTMNPLASAVCSKPGDCYTHNGMRFGWQNLRSELEYAHG